MAIRRNTLLLFGALLVILGIYLFAFVGFGEVSREDPGNAEDVYNLKRRFAPEQMKLSDKRAPPKEWPAGGVDVVYFWTRPMTDARMDEFVELIDREANDPDVVAEEMAVDFAQMQFYFARGLEHFAPWLRTLLVVIPDNVGVRPFNLTDPRVRYIRHSEIIPDGALPIFNWRALFTNFAFSYKNVSSQFVYADDLSFLISYFPPTYFRNESGYLKLPLVNEAYSTPLGNTEANILEHSARTVRECITAYKTRLGFSDANLERVFNPDNVLPKFEARGLNLLDRRVLSDLYAVCHDPLEATRLHRFRRKHDVDLVYMHHTFIYYMRELYRDPLMVAEFINAFDADNDERYNRAEILNLARALGLDQSAVGEWIEQILNQKELHDQTELPFSAFVDSPSIFARITDLAVKPQYRYVLATSPTIAIELRTTIPLKLGTLIMPVLKSGDISSLWVGPRILGPHGDSIAESVEALLWNILRHKFTTLETVYKPPNRLGLWIGIGYFTVFVGGSWALTKWLLYNRAPRKRN